MSRLQSIDAPEFARLGRVLEGQVPLADLGRLAGELSDASGDLEYRVAGELDRRGYPVLVLDLQARLPVTCQRCLRQFELPVTVHNRVRPVEAGGDALLNPGDEALDAEEDVIAADGMLDVQAMIEDEMILALPLAPRHEACELAGGGIGTRIASPFGVLVRLKNGAGE